MCKELDLALVTSGFILSDPQCTQTETQHPVGIHGLMACCCTVSVLCCNIVQRQTG